MFLEGYVKKTEPLRWGGGYQNLSRRLPKPRGGGGGGGKEKLTFIIIVEY